MYDYASVWIFYVIRLEDGLIRWTETCGLWLCNIIYVIEVGLTEKTFISSTETEEDQEKNNKFT